MQRNGFDVRLKSLLKQKGLTQSQVAIAAGTSVPSVNRWTRGGEIEYENLRTLADYLEVNWVWLRYGDEAISSLQDTLSNNNAVSDTRRQYLSQIMDNETRMKSALDMAEIVHWEWNVLTGSLNYSENALSVFEQSPDLFRSIFLPFGELTIEALTDLFSKQAPYQWDFALEASDGKSTRWFTSRGKLFFDLVHRPIKIIAITTEITSRKLAEQALERSEYMMRKIIETIPVGLWAADETGKICLANPEVKRIWGGAKYVQMKDYGQYKGRWEKTGKKVDATGWTLARAVTHGEVSSPEVVNIEAFDGVKRTIIMYATPLLDNNNKIIGAIEVNQDITDTKTPERSLQQNLNQWDLIFNQTLFGVVYFNHDNIILKVNEQLAKYLKKSPEILEGTSIDDLFNIRTTVEIHHQIKQVKNEQIMAFQLLGILKQPRKEQQFNMYFIHDKRIHKMIGTIGLIFLST